MQAKTRVQNPLEIWQWQPFSSTQADLTTAQDGECTSPGRINSSSSSPLGFTSRECSQQTMSPHLLRLERGALSMVKRRRQAANEYPPRPRPSHGSHHAEKKRHRANDFNRARFGNGPCCAAYLFPTSEHLTAPDLHRRSTVSYALVATAMRTLGERMGGKLLFTSMV